MKTMQADIRGLIRNTFVSTGKPLMPVFEAISNSFHAIEDAQVPNGEILITATREPSLLDEVEPGTGNIVEFVISDNGIGMNDENYEAFLTADTTYKQTRGGKGIGRFTWLVVFERAVISSKYVNNGECFERKFTFSQEGITHYTLDKIEACTSGTDLRLCLIKNKYQKYISRKRLDVIARFILEEFLSSFRSDNCPFVKIQDELNEITINNLFIENTKSSQDEKLNIKGHNFELCHLLLYTSHLNDHYLYLCADERVVRSIKLSGIKNLPKRFNGSEGKEFVYGAYLKGEYLDENVKSDRSDFNIVDDPDGFIDEITYRDIISEVQYKCSNYLKPLTDIIAQEKEQRVNSFIQNEGVFYRPIINHLKDSIERVEPDATNSDMDRELYKGYLQLLEKTHIETDELFKQNEDGNEIEEYEGQFEEVFNNISDLHKTDLARYVLHRKVVLKFLKIQLSRVEGKKYKTEDRIHNIIFPMGKTSDDIPFDKHNLWIIDERLAFHTYLASDKPLSNTVGGSTSKKRPDIIIFDKAHAFTEGNNAPYSSITIIEFKRPQRKDYSEKENPITQVYDYIDDIKNRRKQTIDGRPISIGENIPFYCYIICDITSNLVRWAEAAAFYKTPDQIGYFGYNPNKHAYVEVISYNKLVNDSEKRNKAFFDKLNLPSGQ